MAKPYFRQVPSFQYVSRKKGERNLSEYIPVKNLFKRGKLRDDIFGNLVFFEKYTIIGDEKPYNVAYKFYGNETLDWVILLSNNILNIQTEWPLSQRAFDRTMLEKYGSYETLYSGIHHYETREIKNSLGITVVKSGIKMQPTWKTNGNFLEITNSKIENIYSGDGITPSNEVTVELKTPILRLSKGKQIYIKNVSAQRYNGYQTISEIVESDVTLGVSKFKYQIPVASETASPTLSDKEEVLFVISEDSTLSGSSYYYEYWDDGFGYSVLVPSTSLLRAVTNYEYEVNVEDAKRNIYVLKSEYLNVIFNDMDSLMTYKNGGVQYVNATMKRGDNIRLYE